MRTPGLFRVLAPAHRVLIAGAGGGFDIYAGLPLALSLIDDGHEVFLANLSFSELHLLDSSARLAENVSTIDENTTGLDDYFPERTLATWLAENSLPSTVYAFGKVGVLPLRAAYAELVQHVRPDAIVLVDGGNDIMMRGDETGIGTPVEDATSLAAVAGLTTPAIKVVTCLGFGIDSYHGVTAVQALENIAALDRDGAYLGAFSIPGSSREARLYRDAVRHAIRATPMRPSIVHGQIAAALAGEFGDVHTTARTFGSELFVNPLMAMYFSFDLEGLARHNLYLDLIEDTVGMRQVAGRIEWFRRDITFRASRRFPH